VKKFIKMAAATAAMIAATTTHAAAEICIPILNICFGGPGGGGGGGGVPSAPEIDVTQGAAAVAILLVATLLLRERFLRQRAGA
jgi:hypothetical protein